MPHKEVFLTPQGLEKLKAELEHLRTVRRQEVAEGIHRAKEIGGTTDNAEYEDAKNLQAFVEGRILTLEKMIQSATIIQADQEAHKRVKLGSRVLVSAQEGKESYTIVGSAEADPAQGKISNESPVGRALLGRRVGEEVEVAAPAGTRKMLVLDIS